MKKVDLHIHTNISDGTWDVHELKNEIKKEGIKIFSITDHDVLDNIGKMKKIITPEDDLIFIPGVEVSATHDGKEYHLTVYNFDNNIDELIELINWNLKKRLDYNMEFISYLGKKDPKITVEDYCNYKNDNRRGGWKSLNYLYDKGIYKNMFEMFNDLIASGLKLTFKDPSEVVEVCKSVGAKVFLAHPSYYVKGDVLSKKELDYWKKSGISGIECYSPYGDSGEQINYYKDYCKKNKLLISGGSDCHGNFIPTRLLGKPEVYDKDLDIEGILL